MARRVLNGKRLIITGASSGIGEGLTIEAARRGCEILATGRNEERLRRVAEEARRQGGRVEIVVGDLNIDADRHRIIRSVEQYFGGLDLLINNAGIGSTGHFQYAGPERLRQIMETNFFAVCELTRLAIPLLKNGNDPAILMINSVAGRRAIASRSEYSASKFALMGFTEAIRAELSKDNIQVHTVLPGLTQSNFEQNMIENTARHSLHAQRSMSAIDCAKLILNSIEARQNETVLTLKGKMLVLFSRLFPRFVDRKMAGFVKKLYAKKEQEQQEAPARETVAH
jgi:short-subunit dehydrogenase